MKSQLQFLQQLLDDLGNWCHVSTHLDFKTIEKRVETEGFSFLTITLPQFGKDFERSLDLGEVEINAFPGYARKGRVLGEPRRIPVFLEGFMSLVFDPLTGILLDEPNINAIRAIRQITLMFAKMELECTEKRTQAAFEKYLVTEEDMQRVNNLIADAEEGGELSSRLHAFRKASTLLWSGVFTKVDELVYNGKILPKHGSGSTADGLKGNRKYMQVEWTDRLEEWFSWTEFLYPSYSLALADEDRVHILTPEQERPVKVITVPKTLKTPRIIAMEPTCMQYVQQGLLEVITDEVERNYYPRSFISWSSQGPNQGLARDSSISGRLATLDLSEASDRVSNSLVKILLENHPNLRAAVDSCRSRRADVQGEIIDLAKFASMGSALCFPIEAMVFMTIILSSIALSLNKPVSRTLINRLVGKVRVYGDDIIVPVEYVNCVIEGLEAFGLQVNSHKSFWSGKFRESCGMEYFDGHDVTITRVRSVFPTSRRHASEVASTVSLRNQLFSRGYVVAVDYLDNLIEGIIPFPIVEETSSALGRLSHDPYIVERTSSDLQQPLVKAAVLVPKLPSSKLDGSGALMKYFLKRGDLPFFDEKHLSRAGRPVSVDIKTRWTRPY